LTRAYGATEIDARYERIIPNHHIRIFSGGISKLSRVTGKEHDKMSRVLVGVELQSQVQKPEKKRTLNRTITGKDQTSVRLQPDFPITGPQSA
jgi:hypothetical protein